VLPRCDLRSSQSSHIPLARGAERAAGCGILIANACAVTARYFEGRVMVEASSVQRFQGSSLPTCPRSEPTFDASALVHYHAAMVLALRSHGEGAHPASSQRHPASC
jgi:hypothetical protein